MKNTKEIMYYFEEAIKDLVREELEKENISQEIVDEVIEKDKSILLENYNEIVIEFLRELLGINSKTKIKKIKHKIMTGYFLNEHIVNGVMDWVIKNKHLDTLERIYKKKEEIKKVSYECIREYESYFEQLLHWQVTLDNYEYYDIELAGIDSIFQADHLIVVVELLETYGNWKEIQKEIAKGILLGKKNPFEGCQIKLMVEYRRGE